MKKYVELKQMSADEPVKLSILKSNYNRLASKFNIGGYGLHTKSNKELLEDIKNVEKAIDNFTST